MECLYCGSDLVSPRGRRAFDPWLGRLWRICPDCHRWNAVALEDRWEALEALERAARDQGRTVLRTDHLDLVAVQDFQVVRVGRAPRPELAVWRYGSLLPAARLGLIRRIRQFLLGLPSSSFGYNAGHGAGLFPSVAEDRWFASPFIEDAGPLTAAFLQLPLAARCPGCDGPLAVAPWSFQALRVVGEAGGPAIAAACAVCGTDVTVSVRDARPALRIGLFVVNRRLRDEVVVTEAARALDRADGPAGLLDTLGREDPTLGDLDPAERLALGFALDEQSEGELLEAEWREAEELAALMDGELTEVPGFDAFRRRVLGGDPEADL
jgi:hypothetical protein